MDLEQFDSGAVRDTQSGKVRYELITPTFKKDLAALLTDKAEHYGDRNWEKGIPTARTFSSLLRHVEALGRGEYLDEESGHPHTVLAAANLMFIHEFHGTEFDTLEELMGPALHRSKWGRPVGSVETDTIEYEEPEPPRDTKWIDTEGDTWTYGEWGWFFSSPDYGTKWSDLEPVLFPMERVK